MAEILNGLIKSIEINLGTVGVFFVLLTLTVALELAFVIACIFKKDFTLKKRASFLPIAVGIVVLQGGAEIAFKGQSLVMLLVGVMTFAVCCALLIPVKRIEYKNEHIEFAKFIDQKVKRAHEQTADILSQPIERIRCVEKPKEVQKSELDYSHVKNILKKMEFYPLSTADKRQVSDLTDAVNLLESGDCSHENKSRVNDGLGALLKIMSKHGI